MTQTSFVGKLSQLEYLNPNWQLARDHGSASRPGIQTESARVVSHSLCPCCLNVIDKEPIGVFQSSKQLSFLGVGFPLFYNLLKYCIILTLLLIVTCSTQLIFQGSHEDCVEKIHPINTHLTKEQEHEENACMSSFIKISKSAHAITQVDQISRIVSFITTALLLLYVKDNQIKLGNYHNERNLDITDYCFIMRNLPKVQGIQSRIKQLLRQGLDKPYQVQDIYLVPQINYLLDLEEHKKKLNKQKNDLLLLEQNQNKKQKIKEIQKEIQINNIKMEEYCGQVQQSNQKDQLVTEKAIVFVNSQTEKQSIVEQFQNISDKQMLNKIFYQHGKQIKISIAPQPLQIIWANINRTQKQKNFRLAVGWLLTILFLSVVTVTIYFIVRQKSKLFTEVQKNHSLTSQYNGAVALVFISIIAVQFFNKFIMHWVCQFEKHQTTSQLQFSYALKYSLGMFFTTAVMTLAVQDLSFDNYTGRYGVVEEETIIFLMNGFFVNIVWLCHPWYYVKKFRRWLYMGKKNITQKQANQLMEDVPYDMGKRYAEVMETMWFMFLYSSLIPIGPFIILIGLCIYYWVDKYNLLHRSTINTKIGSKLPINATIMLSMILILKPLGQLIFDFKLRSSYLVSTIVMLCFGVIFNIIPWNKVLQIFLDQKFKHRSQKYSQVQHTFKQTYYICDPVHKHLRLESFILNKNLNGMKKVIIKQYERKVMGTQETFEILQGKNEIEHQNTIKQIMNMSPIKSRMGSEQKKIMPIQKNDNSQVQMTLKIP